MEWAAVIYPCPVLHSWERSESYVEVGERPSDDGIDAVDIQADVVIVRIIGLLEGIEFHGEQLVIRVSIQGRVGEAEKLSVAVIRVPVSVGKDYEGQPFTYCLVIHGIQIEDEGGIEGDNLPRRTVSIGGGGGIGPVPDLVGFLEDNSAGVVDEEALHVAGIYRELKGVLLDFGVPENVKVACGTFIEGVSKRYGLEICSN